ncbi:MAG: prepilin peptidase [Candidatus Omnitrophica bacterium]|nr:prepilin peptidase [Candidatus Omnitrophota bacterium]
MPREESLIRPRSRCPHCRHPIAWHDNIPLFSWAALRGRCRHCGAPIHWRYPVVELLTASLTVAVLHRFGAGPLGWAYVAFVAALIAVSFIDLEFQIIPDEISLGGLALGVLLSALLPALHGTDARLIAAGRSVLGLLVGGGVLYLTGLAGDLIFRKESMGGGDVKLMAMAGSLLGWKAALTAFFLAPFLALLPGLYVLFFKRSHVIPYGPFLSLALVVSLFFGTDLLRTSGVEETVKLMWEYYGPVSQ